MSRNLGRAQRRPAQAPGLLRRHFLRLLGAAPFAATLSASGRPARAADLLVTEIDAMKPIVETLQYRNDSEKPGQECANCNLYTKASDERGRCTLFTQGQVAARGWCASWAPLPAGEPAEE